jgi:hypothetical protein
MLELLQRWRILAGAAIVATLLAIGGLLALRDEESAKALTWDQLRNTTYPSELPRSKAASLENGVYEEEVAPGSATKLKIQIADIAGFGQIDADRSVDSAIVLIGSPGGSGTFIYLVAVLNQAGVPDPAATVLLGDRVAVRAVDIRDHRITVRMRVRGPSDPFAVLTNEVTRVYEIQNGQLELISEQAAQVPSTPPDQFSFQPQQLALQPGKSISQKGILEPGTLATYLIYAEGGQELRVTSASQFNNAILSIQGVDDLSQLVSRTNYAATWSGAVPSSQTYAVTVVTLAGNDLAYELKVELRPAPTPLPTATPKPPPASTRVPGSSLPAVPTAIRGAFRPAPVQLSSLSAGAASFLDGRQPAWGLAAASPSSGILYSQNGDVQFELASTVKVLIAIAVLDNAQRENRYVDSFELSLLWPMITLSDNDSATKLWNQIQGGPGLAQYLASIGETGVRPYSGPFWGTSTASPSSLATILARATFGDLLNSDHRTLLLNLLQRVTPSQRWGVTAGLEGEGGSAGALVGVKDGWYPAEAGWRVNSIGFVVRADGQRYYTIAVLTNGQPSWNYGIATIEGAARQVNAALLDSAPVSVRP